MSEKNKRAEELLFGKERMTFTEIMQSMEACAKINLEAIETIEALGLDEIVREDGEPKRKPTMNEIRALYGLGAINNNEYVHLRKENAEDAVR